MSHRKTGVYWFRKRLPAGITALTGRNEVNKTLGTKDLKRPSENMRRCSRNSKPIAPNSA
ncbi:DUF6538 domain-containing protein [Mesorhizobium atlanticum]